MPTAVITFDGSLLVLLATTATMAMARTTRTGMIHDGERRSGAGLNSGSVVAVPQR